MEERKCRFRDNRAAIIKLVLCIIILVSISTMNLDAQAGKPIKIGVIQPLEGECAPWGVPIVRGAQIWADEWNADGGLLCGDGKKHLIEVTGYTNICYYPAEELKAAKKAILEDKKGFLFQTYTPADRKALVPLLNSSKVLSNSYGAGYLSPKCPYLLGGITGLPTCYLGLLTHVVEIHPEIKRIAIVVTNNSAGIAGQAYYAAACEVLKDKVTVVYNGTIDEATKEFYPILGAVMKEKPDMICHMGLPFGPMTIFIETAMQLGYDGYWLNETWSLANILQRVTPDKMEGRFYSAWGGDASVPGFHERFDRMYATYEKKYGLLEWSAGACVTYASLATLEPAFKVAKSIDAKTVMETLYAMPKVDHPIFGESLWGGKEIYGTDHHLLTPIPIYVVKGGKQAFSGVFNMGPWWQKNKSVAMPVLKKYGQVE